MQRLSMCLLLLLGYACVSAVIISEMDEQVGLQKRKCHGFRLTVHENCHYKAVVPNPLFIVSIGGGHD